MTMTKIETVTLGSTQASIDFNSIAGSFTDLLVVASLRHSATGVNIAGIKFNGSTSNFNIRYIEGTGSATGSANTTTNYAGLLQGSSSTSNTFASTNIYIPNYAGSTNKSYSVDTVTENNAAAAFQHLQSGLWSNTAAITSISLYSFEGSLVAGCTATLYGILKGSGGATVS